MSGGPRWDRRRLLRTGAVALGGAGAGWTSGAATAHALHPETPAAAAAPGVSAPPAGTELAPRAGRHQAGVTTPPQAHVSLLGWDLVPGAGREQLVRLLRLLSDDVARLEVGRPALADTEPELAAFPSRLTITLGLGPRVLRDLVPASSRTGLAELPAFERDQLDDAWGQSDVVAQVCCDDPLTLAHARRVLVKDSRTLATLRWQQDGFRHARGTTSGTTRNLMGQVDGTVNPDPADPDFESLVWVADGPLAGGTHLVVRRIRMHLDTWDRVDRIGREATIGRRLDNGAPLTGKDEHDPVDLEATDRFGFPVIDPASHVARARSSDPVERFLRRPYNYTRPDPTQPTGEDSGLLFLAFAADPHRQFVPVQRRLAELDRLNAWVTPIGSGVYAVPPAAPEGGYVGQQLLEPSTTSEEDS